MFKKSSIRPTCIASFCAFIVFNSNPNFAQSNELNDNNLSEEQVMLLTDIDMEIDSIPASQLDPVTKPEGFDDLSKALDDIGRALEDLEITIEEGENDITDKKTRPLIPSERGDGQRPSNTGNLYDEALPSSINESGNNNSFGKANPVNPNGQLTGSIQPRRDTDWYVLQVKEQGQLSINSLQIPKNIALVMRAWNGNKDVITDWFAPLRVGGELKANIDLKEPGKYFLEVHDKKNSSQSTENYLLDLQFTPSGDSFEPNNSFGKAALIDLDSKIHTTILPLHDVDWYRFEVTDQGELKILADQVAENLAIVFRLWNANKDLITGWLSPLSKGGPTEATVDLKEAGIYYLEVHDDRNDQRSVQPFTFSFEFIASGDSMEPNNSFGTSTQLPLGETVSASIIPRTDSDWYRVDVDRQGELNVEITQSPKNLDIVFRVWNAEKNTISNWQAPLGKGGDVTAKVSLPEPGSYYIEVRDSRNDDRSVDPYNITITLK